MATRWMKHTLVYLLVTLVTTSLMLSCRPPESKGEGFLRERIRERVRERIKERIEERRQEGGGQRPAPEGTAAGETRTLTVQGTQRTYLLYTPKPRPNEPPLPLVIGFHGGRSNPQRFALTTGFDNLAERERFVVAYPAGLEQNWNDGREAEGLPKQNDVAFVSAMIDDIQKVRGIDRRRVYATGISNGGFMTQRLACELNNKIAAFASVAATMPAPLASRCRPGRTVPVLIISSPNDQFVPWQGGKMTRGEGGTILSIPQVVDFWKANNQCTTTSAATLPVSNAVDDGTQISGSTAKGASANSEVTLVQVDGGGHTWPGGNRQPEMLVGKTTQKLNGSQAIWAFFKRHSLP
jgi:polyhydroxybutyrate depolymerase